MPAVVLVGAQWGDEGKGKVVDFLARQAEVVVRYQGGTNAGHTTVVGNRTYRLHLIPSGILHPGKLCVIGHGVALDPKALVNELAYLEGEGVDCSALRISPAAHLIMPWHIALDGADEDRRGANKIGTTRRGVGPCYMDKYGRTGIRVVDLLDRDVFRAALERVLAEKNRVLELIYGLPTYTVEQVMDEYCAYADRLRPHVVDTVELVNDVLEQGKNVLFEGAQGNLLDIDFGTYPYVTSSHPIAGGACIGAGIGPTRVDRVVGVAKAYVSRVGDGPFPTELLDDIGNWLREKGREYGTTTGRPRRLGWLDLPMLRYTCRISGLTDLAISHLDTLSGLEKLPVCVGYRIGRDERKDFPASDLRRLGEAIPIYQEMEGWDADLTQVRSFADLPAATQRYVELVQDFTGVPVSLMTVGPERTQTIVTRNPFKEAAPR